MTNMKNWITITLLFMMSTSLYAQREVKLKIIETSDIHGSYFPYDFVLRHKAEGGLGNIYTFVRQQRSIHL